MCALRKTPSMEELRQGMGNSPLEGFAQTFCYEYNGSDLPKGGY